MKKIDLGQTISVLANIGVIAGIIFLAFELRQNNEALNLQARLDRENVQRQGVRNRLEYPDLTRATAKALRGESLTLEDEIILGDANRGALMDWRFAYMQVRDGVLEAQALPIGSWRRYFHEIYPRMHDSWADYKVAISDDPEFIEWFEENVVNER